ncbi:TPA: ORF6N domain-containing protein [Morganella morganii]|uniref:ORF6N domain-containing protein n=1 Tax=Morganella morganii TaxID=582 RepID=UPI001BDA70DF|nr:ORF6N domain-containing protein [Morganella morganii]MBT0432694.1 ORF6N domain-containing protein [Morganella morganii subsp. morganii]HCT4329852.1 ORF6N domain-containing protein [Morganella morganii]HCT7002352.1 ORF6N domain-containing protein [Morganella morganii]
MSQITLANNNAVVTQSRFTVPEVYYRDQKVITTESLAVGYGADAKNIQDNFSNNKDRFVEGKHYFKLEGAELHAFKNCPDNFGSVNKHARNLILWTERGASRHAKMLETDQAWDYFELLEETYFNSRKKNADLISKKDLALMVIQAEEEKEIAYAQRDQAIETKAWISRRREATAMATASVAVREKNALAAKLGTCKKHATVLAVENILGTKFKWHPLKKWCADNGAEVKSVPDERYGKANSYPAAAWKAVHNVNIAKLF